MPQYGMIHVVGPANRSVYFKGIYDTKAAQLNPNGQSTLDITAELGAHTLVTIIDKNTYDIDYEGTGRLVRDNQRITIVLNELP